MLSSSERSGGAIPVPPNKDERGTTVDCGPKPWTTGLWIIIPAILTGSIAWGVGESLHEYFDIKAAAPSRFDFTLERLAREQTNQKNATLCFAIFGAVVGLMGGVQGGLRRRSAAGALMAGVAGAVAGGIFGGVVTFALAPAFARFHHYESPTLLLPIAVRGGTWAAIGAAAGLAFGLGSRGLTRLWRPIAGGVVGGAVAAGLVEFINAVVSPMDRNDQSIPDSLTGRLVMYLVVATAIALGAFFIPSSRLSAVSPGRDHEPG